MGYTKRQSEPEEEQVADDPATATVEQLRQMLQTMLATRFKLQVTLKNANREATRWWSQRTVQS